ncbi:MAG: hypothetical protein QGF46_04055 [Planctomycetota bacterium]|jgi:hypothetical protein|nr:hypothetical protein [Planctomycetota bacterium]
MKTKFLLSLVIGALTSCQSPSPLLHFPDGQAPLNEIFSFNIELIDGPADAVGVDADMPSHGHGMITAPQVTRIDGSNYLVDGMMLHMPGYWEIFVEVTRDNNTQRFVLPLTLEAWQ